MPRLIDIAKTLREHAGRFDALDAFVDDIDELRSNELPPGTLLAQDSPVPIFVVDFGDVGHMKIELYSAQGIVRFSLLGAPTAGQGDSVAAGAVLGGLLGGAIGAASKKKEGLLGGLVLGMLVGAALGTAAPPANPSVERVRALQFDPTTSQWHLYDGPLLRWAKKVLQPNAAA